MSKDNNTKKIWIKPELTEEAVSKTMQGGGGVPPPPPAAPPQGTNI